MVPEHLLALTHKEATGHSKASCIHASESRKAWHPWTPPKPAARLLADRFSVGALDSGGVEL